MVYLSCPIHLDRIKAIDNPVALPCGHVFCTPCLNHVYGSHRVKPCPLCNKPAKKTSFIKLYVLDSSPSPPGSPNGTQIKCEKSADLTTGEGRGIRDTLKELCNGGSIVDRAAFNTAIDVSQRMATFSENIEKDAVNIETKCLAQEIKDASSRFQLLLFPQLETVLNLRQRIETLESQNTSLEAKLTQKKGELDTISRKRVQQEREIMNMVMAKKLTEERVAGLEKALGAVHQKMKDAEQNSELKEGLLKERDEELAKFRNWIKEHKHQSEKYKYEVKRLRGVISEMEQKVPSGSGSSAVSSWTPKPRLKPQRQPLTPLDFGENDSDKDEQNDLEVIELVGNMPISVLKKRRVDASGSVGSSNSVPTMVGQWKPPLVSSVTKKETKPPEEKSRPNMALNLNSKGQAKGVLALGSRKRLGKNI